MATEIDGQWWLEVNEAAKYERITRREAYRRLKPRDPHHLIGRNAPSGRRRTVVYLKSLSEQAQARWREEQLQPGNAAPDAQAPPSDPASRPARPCTTPPLENPPATESSTVAQLPLIPSTPLEQALQDVLAELAQRDPAQVPCVRDRFHAVQGLLNHDWKAAGFPNSREYVRALGKQLGISRTHIWRLKKEFQTIEASAGARAAILSLGRSTPGPKPGTSSPLTPDMRAFIARCWLFERKTRRQCYRALLDYVQKKADVLGAAYSYSLPIRSADGTGPKNPLLYAVIRYINRDLEGDRNPQRNGAPAIKVAAGYIDREYDERAGDTWCMDEWEVDCYPFDDADHRIVYNYGKGNPILHVLTILDERTTYIMDWLLTINIDDDTQNLAERALRTYWAPLRLVADRASRFRELARGRVVVRSTGELAEILDGALGRLGVRPRGSEEKNPRANRLERIHGLYADCARRDFGLAWRPPKRVRGFAGADLREATGIDDRITRHYREHCREGRPSELIPLSQVAASVAAWVEEINNADTDAKGTNGLTRLAAFKHFSPGAEEIARRRPSQYLIDLAFAERAARTVLDGGIIEFDSGARYDAPELAHRIGEEFSVRRFRRDHSQIFVDTDSGVIVARRRPVVGIWDQDLLARESAALARRRKLLGESSDSRSAQALTIVPSDSGLPTPDSLPARLSISSAEWMMSKLAKTRQPETATSEEIAAAFLEEEERA